MKQLLPKRGKAHWVSAAFLGPSLLGLLALCMLLTACGSTGETAQEPESSIQTSTQESTGNTGSTESTESTAVTQLGSSDAEEAYAYLATTTALELDFFNGWLLGSELREDAIYLYGEIYNESYDFTLFLAVLDLEGNLQALTTLPYLPDGTHYSTMYLGSDSIWTITYSWWEEPIVPEEEEEDDWSNATIVGGDGVGDDWTISEIPDADSWGLETEAEAESEASTALPEEDDAALTDVVETWADDIWIYEESDYEYEYLDAWTLQQYDLSGQLLLEVELTPPDGVDYFYVDTLAVAPSGEILISCDAYIGLYDPETGTACSTVDFDGGWIWQISEAADGKLLLQYYDQDYNPCLAYLDTGTWEVGAPLTLEVNTTYTMSYFADAAGQLYAFSSSSLYACDEQTGASSEVLSWLDIDINGGSVEYVFALEDGSFLLIASDSIYNSLELSRVQLVPTSEIPVKTELVLGVNYVNYYLRNMVLSFNRSSEEYRITIRDYSEYNTDENASAWKIQMDLDILNGEGPDLFYFGEGVLDVDSMVSRGLLVDLYTLMGPDTMEADELVDAYRTAMEIDGCLYTIAPAFRVTTMLAAASVVGEESGWSLAEFAALAQRYAEEGKLIWSYMTQEDVLSILLNYNFYTFVDQDSGVCNFDGEEFAALLELCSYFPASYEVYYDSEVLDEIYSMDNGMNDAIRLGLVLTTELSLYSFDDTRWDTDWLNSKDLTLIGIPGVAGNGAILKNNGYVLAISASSAYPEVAWEFLCGYLTQEYADNYVYSFSTVKSILAQQAAASMEKPYYYDENMEKVEYSDYALTQAQVDQVYALLDGITTQSHNNSTVTEIVLEEAAAYFAGQKDVQTVAKLIQNRVQTYLDEKG